MIDTFVIIMFGIIIPMALVSFLTYQLIDDFKTILSKDASKLIELPDTYIDAISIHNDGKIYVIPSIGSKRCEFKISYKTFIKYIMNTERYKNINIVYKGPNETHVGILFKEDK